MEQPDNVTHRFEFRGQAGEYFRIWIVNVLLTILTLGIYSAWAKVRTNQYFYRNTFLDGASFDYLAQPLQILKGRLILVAGIIAYSAAGYFAPPVQLAMMVVVMLLIPWIVQRAMRFRLYNTGYRNLRFHFAGGVGESYLVSLKGLLATVFSFGLASPWGIWLRARYTVDNARYGTSAFSMSTPSSRFFGAYYGGGLIIMLSVVIGAVVMGAMNGYNAAAGQVPPDPEQQLTAQLLAMLIYLPGYLLGFAFISSRVFTSTVNHLQLDDHRFAANMRADGLAWVMFSNAVAIVFSLGLLLPWAKIRLARYRLERVTLLPAGDLSGFVADQRAGASAAGDEVGDYLDLDLGF